MTTTMATMTTTTATTTANDRFSGHWTPNSPFYGSK